MTKLLLNFILIYAIITVITAILIIWRAKKDRDVILIIAGSSAIAILLFCLFYIPALERAKTSPDNKTGSTISSTPTATLKETDKQTKPTKPESLMDEPKGPFPMDNTVTEKERQTGRLFNIWRRAVLTRNISQINQLDSQIKACGDDAIPFLTKLAKEDANERIRAFATRILGRMNNKELSALFIELLKNDTSAFVRENSCWSLGRLGNTESLDILQKTADSDASAPVRQAATEAIETIKTSAK